jgi:hypothetical protein
LYLLFVGGPVVALMRNVGYIGFEKPAVTRCGVCRVEGITDLLKGNKQVVR